jgi:hypothetical protein
MSLPILDDESRLRPEAAQDLLNYASVIACECPRHLIDILTEVRKFKEYERGCQVTQAKDREIHEWLEGAADNLDRMISATISQLARMEGMVDEENRIVPLGTAK